MILRVMVVGLRAVVHVGDLSLIVVATVHAWGLSVSVVTLAGVLAVIDGGGPRRAPAEAVSLAGMNLIHRARVGRWLQLVGAWCQRRRRSRQIAVGSAATGWRRADPRIRRLRRQQRSRQG